MADELVFYTNPMSRGRIVRWMLEEVGAPYHTEYLEYGTTMKAPDYLAINPMGKVPSIRHGKTIVSECAAICAYLADAFPEAGLAPPLNERGAYYRWMFFGAGPLEAAVTNTSMGLEVPEDLRGRSGYGSLEAVLGALEHAVSGGDYIAASHFTAVDVYVGSQIGWGLEFGTIENRPAFSEYWDLVSGREARRRASEIDNEAMAGRTR